MNINTKGRSLELYFIDGRPDGMLTAEVFNWTGHVLMAPRTQITAALARKEAKFTGVYLLLGEQEGEPKAYIGEGEDISDRIRNHDTKKDWWSSAVLVTSTSNILNKAHVKYLEARLIEEARTINRISLDNGTAPVRPGLSEAAQANMESFLDYLMMVLPALRVDMFIKNTRENDRPLAAISTSKSSVVFELNSQFAGIQATAVLQDGDFVVEKGSLTRGSWVGQGSEGTTYGRLYAELVKTGVIVPQGQNRVFVESYAFKSPSAAAAVVTGRPANGTIEWKVKGQGKTYKDWEAEQLALQPGSLSS
ncbi:GIY-YIG nuclease family protein [Bradyrhizobium elkanii]